LGKVCRSPDTGLPLSESLCGNYVASEAVPCVFLAAPHLQRHITADATEEIKLDGYRAIAVKSAQGVTLHSRTGKSLNKRFPYIVESLRELPDGSELREVIARALGAIDQEGVLPLITRFSLQEGRDRSALLERTSRGR